MREIFFLNVQPFYADFLAAHCIIHISWSSFYTLRTDGRPSRSTYCGSRTPTMHLAWEAVNETILPQRHSVRNIIATCICDFCLFILSNSHSGQTGRRKNMHVWFRFNGPVRGQSDSFEHVQKFRILRGLSDRREPRNEQFAVRWGGTNLGGTKGGFNFYY